MELHVLFFTDSYFRFISWIFNFSSITSTDVSFFLNNNCDNAAQTGLQLPVLLILDETGEQVASIIPDPDGRFSFDGLPPGQYTVEIDTDDLPPELGTSSTPTSQNLVIGSGDEFTLDGFGFIGRPTAIGLASFTADLVEDGVAIHFATA